MTGAQTVVSSGGFFVGPYGLAIEASGNILVADANAQAVIRVDPVSGAQTLVSSGGLFVVPAGIAIVPQIGPPTNKDQCKNGGWQRFNFPRTFKNQGDCIQFVNTGK